MWAMLNKQRYSQSVADHPDKADHFAGLAQAMDTFSARVGAQYTADYNIDYSFCVAAARDTILGVRRAEAEETHAAQDTEQYLN